MPILNAHPLPRCSHRIVLLVLLVWSGSLCRSTGIAGEIQLKNGMILRGDKISALSTLSGPAIGFGREEPLRDTAADRSAPIARNIVLVDTDWQRTYVPLRQIPADQIDLNAELRQQVFHFKHTKKNQLQVIASVGSISDVQPFDEFGVRRLTLETAREKLHIVQAITRIEPDHVIVEGLNYKWKSGMPLKAIPVTTIDAMLRQQIKVDDPAARLRLVSFYRQAEYFQEAFAELDAIAQDFPEQKTRCDSARAELIDQFGREVLRELKRRKTSGQHQLAEEYAKTLSRQQAGGAVMEEVKLFLSEYETSRQMIEKARNLLIDRQANLKDPKLIERSKPLRSEISEQLDFETLPRLDPFLKAESDLQMTPEQHLALAYSGWLVGAVNAITDLEQAVRLFDARFALLEYARAENQQECDQLLQQFRRLEGIGPKIVMQLATRLPPFLDSSDILPGEVFRVRVTPNGHTPEIGYSVLLPPEYSPHHNYPMLIVLRSRGRKNDDLLRWWGGQSDRPGPAMKRGYIVITPEYAEDNESEYSYSLAAHETIIETLRDARRRFNIDSDRVFLAGHGMGADAAFDIGMSHPDEFAGVIPIGGNCLNYPKFTRENGRYTAWYVVGKGFDGEHRDASNDMVFEDLFKSGVRFDFLLVEYLGRGLEGYLEEVPKLFEWMDLHRRTVLPQTIQADSLRKTDNRFFWVTAVDLPRTTVLPSPSGPGSRFNTMTIKASVSTVSANNIVTLRSPSKKHIVRFLPGLIDFDKRVVVRTNDGRQEFNGFITPDNQAILEELRSVGDRSRLPLAVKQF